MTPDVDYDALDQGIRDIVRAVNEAGFETTDSGDGVSKPEDERTIHMPHVVCVTGIETMIRDSHRLSQTLPGWHIEATYSPNSASVTLIAMQPALMVPQEHR